MFDLLIRNANIVDGTGQRPAFSGDIGIIGKHIVEVGKLSAPAHRVIDADGQMVTPGFVDIHTHYDGQVSWDRALAPSSQHGVTSIGMGNCGVGFAPVRPNHHSKLISLLEGIEDIPGTALTEGLTWDWESFPDYLDALERRKFACDVGAQIPHAALRLYVMGDRGSDHTLHPTDDEVARMEEIVHEAIVAGAIGFSTSRAQAHRTMEGDNIGTLHASDRELGAIAKALRRANAGVLQVVSEAYMSTNEALAAEEMQLMERLLKIAQRPLSFSLVQSPIAPYRWRAMLDWAEAQSVDGRIVRAQVAPRPVGAIIGLTASLNPFYKTGTYQELASLDLAERVRIMAKPEVKSRILAEYKAMDLKPDNPSDIVISSLHVLYRMDDPVNYEPLPACSMAGEAQKHGREAIDYTYDVILEEGGMRLLYSPILNYSDGNLDVTYEMMASDYSLYGLSDGGAHCGAICDASFTTTTLSLWSRGNRHGKRLPIERLVHGYTQRNAAYVGWEDRGVIAPGYLADLNVINIDELDLPPPVQVRDLPAGGQRLLQGARGYRWTVKSGIVTFESGEWTSLSPGRLVRGAQARLN